MANVAELLAGGGKSWSTDVAGEYIEGTVVTAEVQQQTDLDTDEPVFWDPAKTRPKMMVVATLQTETREDADDDGKRVVYFSGNKFTQLQKSGAKNVEPGDYLKVTFVGLSDRAPAKKGYNAAKLYSVEYRKGVKGVSLGEDGPAASTSPSGTATSPAAPSATATAAPSVAASAPAAVSYGARPDSIPEAAWNVMPDQAKAAVSPPAAGADRPDYMPQAAWDAMSPEQQKAVAGF